MDRYLVIEKQSNALVNEFTFRSTIDYDVISYMDNLYGKDWRENYRLIEVNREV